MKFKNRETVHKFMLKMPCQSSHLKSNGCRLVSYNTTIAEWSNQYGILLLNKTKYSRTTSNHQNLVVKEKSALGDNTKVVCLTDLPREVLNLELIFIRNLRDGTIRSI